MRVPVHREEVDGTITDGTCNVESDGIQNTYSDFRGLDGESLDLPPGASIVINLDHLKGVTD